MGVAVPRELDGQVLSDAFHDTSPAAAPAVYGDVNVGKDEDLPLDLSDDEMADVREKLRGWGFAG